MSNQEKSDKLSQAKVSLESSKNRLHQLKSNFIKPLNNNIPYQQIQGGSSQLNLKRYSLSIVVPWWDHSELLDLWERNVAFLKDIEVIFIDNGSQPKARVELQDFCNRFNIKLIRNEENRGFSAANNQGIQLANGDYILHLNNDVEIYELPVEYLCTHAGDGIAGAIPTYENELNLHYIEGWALCIKKSTLQAIGGWSEDYGPGYWDDVDLCYRAKLSGYSLTPIPEIQKWIRHIENATGRDGRIDQLLLHVRNRERFMQNHHIKHPKIIIDGVFFQLNNTGISHVWKCLLEEWGSNGFAKYIIVLDRAGTAPKVAGVSYRTVPAYNYHETNADRQMLQQICDEEGADIFISTYYTTPISTPSVFMGYDMIPELIGKNLDNEPMWREKHYGIKHASAYITISKNTASNLAGCFPHISPSNITVAHCGVKTNLFPANSQEICGFRSQYGIYKPYFLLVGERSGWCGYKNGILFFEAFAQLANKHEFEIVCTGGAPTIEEEFLQYTSGVQVHKLYLTDEELRVAYSGAVVLVYPSLYEGFGMPVIEAMACGCPVIASERASIPEVAGTAALYISGFDVSELVNALQEVQKPESRNQLISTGLEQAKKFSWSKMAVNVSSALIKTYNSLNPLDSGTIVEAKVNVSAEEKFREIKVSAIVSTYNSEKFIRGRLENLVEQTLYTQGQLEIIVIDSNSEQNERSIVREFQNKYPYIIYERTPDRETVYAAWNRGIKMCHGEYVINANTDDRFAKDTLELMAKELESSPGLSAVYGDWMVTQIENDTFDCDKQKFTFLYPEFSPPMFLYYQITSHAALVKKSIFDKIGYYNETLKVFGDRELMLRFSVSGLTAKHISHIVGLYLENPTSLERSATDTELEFSSLREQYILPNNLARLFGYSSNIPNSILAALYATLGSMGKDFYQLRDQNISDFNFASRMFTKSLEIDPTNQIALNNQGIILSINGQHQEALKNFQDALKSHNQDKIKEIEFNLVSSESKNTAIEYYIWLMPENKHYKSSDYSITLQPIVSVIIPTKDRPEMLKIAVQSVLAQTYKNTEIIVVNDGGVDVQELLNRLNYRGNIFYLKHDYPKERSATRNAGIRIATGKYICYLDDDDLYYPNHIQTLVEVLENSEYKVAYTDATKADQEKQDGKYVTINRSVPYSYDFDPDLLMVNNYIPILCIMHERGCLDQTGLFDETLDTHEDWDLWIRMCLKFGSFYHIKQTTCEFTWRTDGSTTTSRRWDDFERTREIVRNRYSSYVNVNSVVQLIAKQPLVSVIIPTKDRPEMLAQAIQSVLNQTFTELEIIVVNDGGVDVQSVISRLNTRGNIVYKKHEHTLERSAARNTGIRVARGKYIAYLDDDDNYYPNHIETLVKFLENSEYKIAYTDAVMAQQEKQNGEYVTVHRSVPYSLDFDKDKILVSNCTPNLCLMHEKSCLNEVGLFDETLSTHEDWDLIIRLSRKFDIAHIKETTCEFTQRNDGTNTSSDNRADFTRTREIIFNRYRQYAEANPTILDAQKEAFIAEAKELAQQVQNLQSQVVQKESELQQAQAEKSQLSAQVETWQRTTQEVQAKLEATQSEKEWVKSQLNSWRQTAGEMQIELEQSRSKLKQAQSELDRSALNLIK
ncbi:MAG: glycosyltransferase [Planktothrix agardhii LY1]|uniref:glycosyltransferase n=1 Tax=Planktothrix agardhii TaxID=1160 RepID=UPI00242DFFDF|nr:glycosyltransferase [Planktothrix agardhii]MCP9296734.1 glycosyltransferase [Planktothrix agardhii LY1]